MKVRDTTKPVSVLLGSLSQGDVFGGGDETWMVCGWNNVGVSHVVRADAQVDLIRERVVVNVVSGELDIVPADHSVVPRDAELVLSRA